MSANKTYILLKRIGQGITEIPAFTRANIAWVGGFLAIYAHLLSGIHLGRLFTMGDFPPYYGATAFEKFLSTWHDGGLGYSYLYNALPAYLGAITALGGPLAQNLFYLALIPAGFLTFAVFVGRFVTRRSARFIAAGVYALNPVTIGDFVNGSIAALIGFVGFPLVLHYLWLVVERDDWDAAIRAGAVFGATTITPWLGFWMIGPFTPYLAERTRNDPQTFVKLVAAGGLGLLLGLPNVHHVIQRLDRFEAGETVLLDTLLWNYANADLVSVLRLAGNHGMLAMNELGYNDHPSMVIGLVIPGVALLAWRRSDLRIFAVVAGSLAMFMALTSAGVTHPLFDVFPPLWSVRNPVKLQYPIALSLAVTFGAGLEAILAAIPWSTRQPANLTARYALDRETYVSAAVVGLVVLSLFAYVAPATGALGLESVRGDDYYIPESYDDVAADLHGPVLWVPYGYTTQLRLRHTSPEHVGIKSGGVLHGIQNADYVSALFADVAAGRPVEGRLRKLGVRYVVVERDPPTPYGTGDPRFVQKWGAPWIWGDPATFADRLNRTPGYSLVDQHGNLSVYEVSGTTVRGQSEQRSGVHAVVYPTSPSVERLGTNRLSNGEFVENLTDWWAPLAETGTHVRPVVVNGESAVEITVNESGERLPLAQEVAVEPGYPYVLDATADGDGVVGVFWYEGEKSPENLVASETLPLAEGIVLQAQGDILSVRVKANDSRLVVRDLALFRGTYPETVGFADNVEAIPGAVLDGRETDFSSATTVAVNLDSSAAEEVGADVRVIDAETVLDGELVFDPALRQGVGIRLPDGRLPARVPDDAQAVGFEDENGTVLDYWIVGTFDETQATVRFTSYDERWDGPPGSEQFLADGWANGFTNAEPDGIKWTGTAERSLVIRTWLASWLVVGLMLVGRWWPVRKRFAGIRDGIDRWAEREHEEKRENERDEGQAR